MGFRGQMEGFWGGTLSLFVGACLDGPVIQQPAGFPVRLASMSHAFFWWGGGVHVCRFGLRALGSEPNSLAGAVGLGWPTCAQTALLGPMCIALALVHSGKAGWLHDVCLHPPGAHQQPGPRTECNPLHAAGQPGSCKWRLSLF